jgi:predicted permease
MWMQDVRYAIRLLKRSPGFAVTATLTLALSIGVNAAIWSAVKGVLIAPLPYPDPDRLVRLFEEAPRSPKWPMAPADFRDYRDELSTFEGIAAYVRADLQLGDAGQPERLRGMQVTRGFFTLLGRPPRLGRDFEEADERKGSGDKVILSHGLWMRRFGGDPGVVGRSIRLSGKPYEVVGVLDAGFQHVGGSFRTYGHGEPVDVWSPLTVPRDEEPSWRYSHFFNVVGRTKMQATPAEIAADLKARGEAAAERYPVPNSPWKPRMEPLKREIVGSADKMLALLSGAALAMLLLACVNVAGLLLGRSAQRAREIGTRAAIGATRWQLARQLLVESLVLAAAGGLLGIAVAFGATRLLKQFGPADMPRLQNIAVDADVLLTALAATLASALVVGLAPAIRLAGASLSEALKEGGRTLAGGAHQRTGKALAATEIALAFVLVVSSGLLLKSFVKMVTKDPGFRPQGAITASLELPTAKYDRAGAAEFHRRAQERIQALPGIRAVTFSSDLPWTGYDENTGFEIVGRQFPEGEDPEARYHFLTPGYPGTTGTPLVAGADFGPEDRNDAPNVVLLNEAAARKYWQTPQAAVGARLSLWGTERTVKGVIGNVADLPWHDRAVPALYFPQAQAWYPQPMFVIVRTDVDPTTLAGGIRRALREIDPELPLANVQRLESVAAGALATRRLTLWLVAAFGATSLLLATVGIYGVMAQAVGQRRHEFAIRQALGATRSNLMKLVFTSAAWMALGGLACGVALALGATRLLVTFLYGVTPFDSTTFVAVAAALLVVAAGAVYGPARQGTRTTTVASLRAD